MSKRIITHLGYRCIGPTITPSKIGQLQARLRNNRAFLKSKKILAALAGKKRFEILYLLFDEKELCVCDMADSLKSSVSAISHQLKILRKHKLVKTRKDAITVFYSLTRDSKNFLSVYLK